MPQDSTGPIRVALVIGQLVSGGAETQLIALAKGLDQSPDFSVVVYCLSRDAPRAPELTDSGIAVHYVTRGLLDGFSRVVPLVRLYREHQIDVAHCWLPVANLWGKWAASLAHVPVIIHGERIATPPRQRLNRVGQRFLLRQTACFVGNSAAVRDMLIRHKLAIPERIRVIPNGIRPETWRSGKPRDEALRALGLPTDRPVVGMVSRLVAAKNVPCLVRAAARLQTRQPPPVFWVAGDGPARPEAEAEVARLGLQDSFFFLGDRRDVPQLMNAMDVSCLCSHYEGFPNAVIEAMAAGKPVVATNTPGTDQVVTHEETGLLSPDDNDEALARNIDRVLSDEALRTRLVQAGTALIESRYTMERMVEAHMALYRELLG